MSEWGAHNARAVTLEAVTTGIPAIFRRAAISTGLERAGQVAGDSGCMGEESSGKEGDGGEELHFDCG